MKHYIKIIITKNIYIDLSMLLRVKILSVLSKFNRDRKNNNSKLPKICIGDDLLYVDQVFVWATQKPLYLIYTIVKYLQWMTHIFFNIKRKKKQ